MRDFQFHTPSTLAEAHSLLSDYGEEARVISGGTGLINMMKQDLIYVDHLVSLQNIDGLNYIRSTGEGLQIGGRTTQQEVATSGVVHENNPLLTETYGEVATVRVRTRPPLAAASPRRPAQDRAPPFSCSTRAFTPPQGRRTDRQGTRRLVRRLLHHGR